MTSDESRALTLAEFVAGKISQAVVGGVFIHFGKRRVIEDEVDENIERHVGLQRHHSQMNQLGGTFADDLHAEQAAV